MTATDTAIVVVLAELLGLLVCVTLKFPFPPAVFVPVGEAPVSGFPIPFPLSFPPPVAVAKVDCAPGASLSATAMALAATGVKEAGIVASREVLVPDPDLPEMAET